MRSVPATFTQSQRGRLNRHRRKVNRYYERPFPLLIVAYYSDLLLRIMEDAKEFDTRIWIAAVAVGELILLGRVLCDSLSLCYLSNRVSRVRLFN